MNMFIIELKAHKKPLIFWCIGTIFMVFAGMSKYAGMSSTGQDMSEMMELFPKSLQAILGTAAFDLSKASGFYGIIYLYLILMTTIHACMLGANIISKEERDKTAEFLLVKPVSRYNIITSKILASLVNIFVLNIVTLIFSFIIVGFYSKGENFNIDIIKLMFAMLILQLIYLSIGLFLAAISKNPKSSTSIATGVLLTTFIISVMIDLNEKLEFLKYLTPFKYYEAKEIMFGGGYKVIYLLLSLMIISVLISLTYVFYKKRDLNI